MGIDVANKNVTFEHLNSKSKNLKTKSKHF